MTGSCIVKKGKPFPVEGRLYEQTSTTMEIVKGRIGSVGTATSQLKLYVADTQPFCVFDDQTGNEGLDTNYLYDSQYAKNGSSVKAWGYGPFVFEGQVKDGAVITQGTWVDPEAGTGKIIDHVAGNYPCGLAIDSVSPSGAMGVCDILFIPGLGRQGSLAELKLATETVTVTANTASVAHTPVFVEYVEVTSGTGGECLTVTVETLTAASNSITLSQTPVFVEGVEAVTATAKGGKRISYDATPLEGDCKVAHATKNILFSTTDNVANAKVRYFYDAGSKAMSVISTTPGRGEVQLATAKFIFNASDSVAEAKIEYWYT